MLFACSIRETGPHGIVKCMHEFGWVVCVGATCPDTGFISAVSHGAFVAQEALPGAQVDQGVSKCGSERSAWGLASHQLLPAVRCKRERDEGPVPWTESHLSWLLKCYPSDHLTRLSFSLPSKVLHE